MQRCPSATAVLNWQHVIRWGNNHAQTLSSGVFCAYHRRHAGTTRGLLPAAGHYAHQLLHLHAATCLVRVGHDYTQLLSAQQHTVCHTVSLRETKYESPCSIRQNPWRERLPKNLFCLSKSRWCAGVDGEHNCSRRPRAWVVKVPTQPTMISLTIESATTKGSACGFRPQ